MKKIFFIISIAAMSTNVFSQTDADSIIRPVPPRKFNHILKFGPLHLLANRFNIGYEVFLPNHKVSFYISPSLYITQNNDVYYSSTSSVGTSKTYGYILDMQVRIYLGDTDFKNPRARFNHLYLAPYGNLAYYTVNGTASTPSTHTSSGGFVSASTISYSNSLSASGGGFALGYQLFLFKNKVTLDAYFGGGVRFSYTANNYDFTTSSNNNNFTPQLSVFDNGSNTVYALNYTGIVPRIGFQIGYTF